MGHSYEEIRDAALDLLAGREKATYDLIQYAHLSIGVAEVFQRREPAPRSTGNYIVMGGAREALQGEDAQKFLEVFWGLFREGIITLGLDAANPEFPFFHVSELGKKIIMGQKPYFFHDVASYTSLITAQVPQIDPVTLIYLQEAMNAFRSGCMLSSSVMLGVATEHTFLLLMEKINQHPTHLQTYAAVDRQRSILPKVNTFKSILDTQTNLTRDIKEDLDTHFTGILSVIRNFRNQSGHPSGIIIGREQVYVLLHLFVPYCKKMYQLMAFYT